jgi:mannonate dehydratase
MKPVWRWFGPNDPISLAQIKQAGATGIVTALHDHAPGDVWSKSAIAAIVKTVEDSGLTWDVCESIWMSDAIKLKGSVAKDEVDAWIETMRHLADAGVKTICYNFMPLLDWTRTDLSFEIEGRGQALRFDIVDFIIYDLHVLKREGAKSAYPAALLRQANQRYAAMTSAQSEALERNIIAGLPGSANGFTREDLRAGIDQFAHLSHEDLRANLASFLAVVVPEAEALGVTLAIHPDDPPMPLFDLPRCVSTADDIHALLGAASSVANGLTFCTGSLGAHPENDLPAMARTFGPNTHFAHLRNVLREPDGSFHEAAVFEGSTNMVAVINELMNAQRDGISGAMPFRPDHGHLLDFEVNQTTNPGYSYLGRLKGLSELQGAMAALFAARS